MSTAASLNSGAVNRRCSSVVLPLPRKPVITLTGRRSALSVMISFERADERRIERVEHAPRHACGRGPESGEIIDDLRAAGAVAQQERAALPIVEAQRKRTQHVIDEPHAVEPLPPARRAALDRGHGVCPMRAAAENTAQTAHRLASIENAGAAGLAPPSPGPPPYFLRGKRRLKSSAISSQVQKRTPGWRIMWL